MEKFSINIPPKYGTKEWYETSILNREENKKTFIFALKGAVREDDLDLDYLIKLISKIKTEDYMIEVDKETLQNFYCEGPKDVD